MTTTNINNKTNVLVSVNTKKGDFTIEAALAKRGLFLDGFICCENKHGEIVMIPNSNINHITLEMSPEDTVKTLKNSSDTDISDYSFGDVAILTGSDDKDVIHIKDAYLISYSATKDFVTIESISQNPDTVIDIHFIPVDSVASIVASAECKDKVNIASIMLNHNFIKDTINAKEDYKAVELLNDMEEVGVPHKKVLKLFSEGFYDLDGVEDSDVVFGFKAMSGESYYTTKEGSDVIKFPTKEATTPESDEVENGWYDIEEALNQSINDYANMSFEEFTKELDKEVTDDLLEEIIHDYLDTLDIEEQDLKDEDFREGLHEFIIKLNDKSYK